jgi:hypothetical protein
MGKLFPPWYGGHTGTPYRRLIEELQRSYRGVIEEQLPGNPHYNCP